jgi:hypothetical protein
MLQTIDGTTGEIVAINEQTLSTPDRILSYLAQLDNALTETYDIADALEIKNRVDIVRFLTNKLDLDRDIKNRAAESQIRTERRLIELVDQLPRNKGTRLGGNIVLPPGKEPTYEELGLTKQQVSRMRPLAQVPIERLDNFIKQAREGENELTVGGACAYARNVVKLGPMMSSDSAEWYTTPDIIRCVVSVLGEIDLDPCSNSKDKPNIPAKEHYTKEEDGLSQSWHGRIYMNPPYGDEVPHWIDKLNLEYLEGRVKQAIALLPARPDTVWFRSLRNYPRCFMFGRVRFNDSPNSAPFPTMLVNVGCDADKFNSTMSKIGDIYARVV